MTLKVIAIAAGISVAVGLMGISAASAVPVNGVAISEAAAATGATEQVWWRWRRWHWRRWHWHRHWRRW
jgi:hypothetical protein